jgi:hypothetical protein
MATIIRVHQLNEDGSVDGSHLEFNMHDFGGHLPLLGDLVVRPHHAGDPADPRRMWEVVGRYLTPGVAFDAGACVTVVVQAREPTAVEAGFLGLAA